MPVPLLETCAAGMHVKLLNMVGLDADQAVAIALGVGLADQSPEPLLSTNRSMKAACQAWRCSYDFRSPPRWVEREGAE